ncbi:hypothetical protein HanRHA438_Chr11g0519191 [Helianthus annuus]|nr:hypothetical protein HanRHA438_Chr11g0519191 [Helianthus annuus]
MALPFKTPHNYLGLLENPSHTETFNHVIDAVLSSKYKTLLTCDAPIFMETQEEFWKNAKLETKDKNPLAINSSIKGVLVTITPQTISEVFELDDLQGKTSFPKIEYQIDFLEGGYEEEMKKDILQKGSFPPAMRSLFHTLLICVSNKTTAFNEIPLKIQYQGYAILHKENFSYSQEIFNYLVSNVNKKSFLLFPRFLSFYLQKKFAKDNAHVLIQGNPIQINILTSETFTRLSKPSKTQTEVPEQNLPATTAPQVSTVEPTA